MSYEKLSKGLNRLLAALILPVTILCAFELYKDLSRSTEYDYKHNLRLVSSSYGKDLAMAKYPDWYSTPYEDRFRWEIRQGINPDYVFSQLRNDFSFDEKQGLQWVIDAFNGTVVAEVKPSVDTYKDASEALESISGEHNKKVLIMLLILVGGSIGSFLVLNLTLATVRWVYKGFQ